MTIISQCNIKLLNVCNISVQFFEKNVIYLPNPSVVISMVVKIAFSAYNASHTYVPYEDSKDRKESKLVDFSV